MRETKDQEKMRMVAQYDYYKKPNGEVDCVMNNKTLHIHYDAAAVFILSYMREIHKCNLLPSLHDDMWTRSRKI
jgi:hypothetical protein